MDICNRCQTEIDEIGKTGQGICKTCGLVKLNSAEIQDKKQKCDYCMRCGFKLPENVISCPNCDGSTQTLTKSSDKTTTQNYQISDTSTKKTKYCMSCGSEILIKAEICPKCGVRVAPPPTVFLPIKRKNPGTAVILSLLIVGLGQIYNGQVGKGIGLIIIQIIVVSSTLAMFGIFGFLIALPISLYSIFDAYHTAEKINASIIRT
ncbi:hypothetical protein ACFLQ6_09555 [Thermoproteota archaeon]